ncbi:MAG TPA: tyrosine-type recombinase/integrase [Tepidisphaeraceae bacterium]|nr:tyrosine-type recombinase/integrase [Tepidisphaeraceae bacterium]
MLFDPVRVRFLEERKRPIGEHLADYRAVMESRGGDGHVSQSMRRLRIMIRLCRVKTWGDLASHPSLVLAARQKLRAARPRGGTLGPRTINAYVVSLAGFSNWMVSDYRAEWSPCRGMRPLAARADIRHARRALSMDEILRLIDAARSGRAISGIPGTERALAYLLATTTGLRRGEIASLSRGSFALAGREPSVSVLAAYTKNGKPACIPLRGDVAELLRVHLAGIRRDKEIFRFPMSNPNRALRHDLAAAGVAYVIDGAFADFHALRHTFVSNLFDSGATPKETQTLARHQDARLTLGIYAHVPASAQRAAVERLAAVSSPCRATDRAATQTPQGSERKNDDGRARKRH